jgi:hypothetical protein
MNMQLPCQYSFRVLRAFLMTDFACGAFRIFDSHFRRTGRLFRDVPPGTGAEQLRGAGMPYRLILDLVAASDYYLLNGQ